MIGRPCESRSSPIFNLGALKMVLADIGGRGVGLTVNPGDGQPREMTKRLIGMGIRLVQPQGGGLADAPDMHGG